MARPVLHTSKGREEATLALLTAQFAEVTIDCQTGKKLTDGSEPMVLPALEFNAAEAIHGIDATARALARLVQTKGLYGGSPLEMSQVDQWVDFARNELVPAGALLFEKVDKKHIEESKAVLKSAFGVLNSHLLSNTFLVGEEITLADIAVAGALLPVLQKGVDEAFRKPYANVLRWFTTMANQNAFMAVVGNVQLNGSKQSLNGGGKVAGAAPIDKRAAKGFGETKAKVIKEEVLYKNTTPKGEYKDVSKIDMPDAYQPSYVEAAWYDWWEKQGYFHADENSDKEKFVIMIPPPNVTGSLHLGHALTNSIQDTLVRWHRMNGKNCLWLPGTDHAGIATQVVVEKKLQREEGKTRHDYGREAFIKEVWKWKDQYGNRIFDQLRRLGSSLDWDRAAFTMDDARCKAVTEAFVRMYEKGLIYRDTRLVNWDCHLKTAVSDMEVDYIDLDGKTERPVPGHKGKYEFGTLTEFAYKVEGSEEEIVVATTRLETMLGDTAVAVHPEDKRYKHLHGKCVVHPFNGRKIPIVLDPVLVDMNFGTGAVKITPAHDPNDYECGKRHKLPMINILNEDGTINEHGKPYTGMMRFDVRTKMKEDMKKLGILRGTRDNPMRLGLCSRSKDVIEPYLKPQWYVNCQKLGADAAKVVRDNTLKIVPEFQKDTWFKWMDNIRDWCISRQLWWGHQVPAWLIYPKSLQSPPSTTNTEYFFVARDEAAAIAAAEKKFGAKKADLVVSRDEDVLDTWFSSGIFPFATLGWPESTPDMKAFYPGTLLETGHDILFFWVARMVMMGQCLTDQLPFETVYLHAMVRDAHGRKMSKSLGNVIDPLDVMEGITLDALHKKLIDGNLDPKELKTATQGQKDDYPNGIPPCGADALRFTLVAYTSHGRDVNLDVLRVFGYRTFCNKLWNVTKFCIMKLGKDFKPCDDEANPPNKELLSVMDKYILHKLQKAVLAVNKGLTEFDFTNATTAIFNFFMYDLCDLYVESIKPFTREEVTDAPYVKRRDTIRNVLYTCLEVGMRLLHPFMCFLSEELWQRLPKRPSNKFKSIVIATYPKGCSSWVFQEAEEQVKLINDAVHAIRSIRTSIGLTNQKPPMTLNAKDAKLKPVLETISEFIVSLSNGLSADVVVNGAAGAGNTVGVVNKDLEVFVDVRGLIDVDAEIAKINKKMGVVQKSLDGLIKKTEAPTYTTKVPEKVRNENAEKIEKYKQELANFNLSIKNFEGMRGQPAPAKNDASKGKKAAKDDDDDFDLFGDDEEADAENEARLKAIADAHKAKLAAAGKSKKVVGKSSVVFELKPWEDTTPLDKMEELARKVEMEGLTWGAAKKAPIGYGIFKLVLMCTIVDDLVSTDALQEALEGNGDEDDVNDLSHYVQSVDIAAFNKI